MLKDDWRSFHLVIRDAWLARWWRGFTQSVVYCGAHYHPRNRRACLSTRQWMAAFVINVFTSLWLEQPPEYFVQGSFIIWDTQRESYSKFPLFASGNSLTTRSLFAKCSLASDWNVTKYGILNCSKRVVLGHELNGKCLCKHSHKREAEHVICCKEVGDMMTTTTTTSQCQKVSKSV